MKIKINETDLWEGMEWNISITMKWNPELMLNQYSIHLLSSDPNVLLYNIRTLILFLLDENP